ncbi:MAG: hypothetical protein EOP21_02000, partial [Hyphomicrobiales bacterium]
MLTDSRLEDSSENFRVVDIEPHVDDLTTKGYTVIPDVMTDSFRERLSEVVNHTIETEERQPSNAFKGLKTIRIGDLLLKDRIYHDLVLAPPIEAINARILGEQSILSSLMTMAIEPGAAVQPLHTDDIHACKGFPRPFPTIMLTAVWATTEFTEENGATHVVPGSHRAPAPPIRDLEDAVAKGASSTIDSVRLTMKPGGVAIWTGAVWHHAGANHTSDDTRVGLTASYNAGWLRGYEAYCFTVPRDVARSFPERLQEMIGYGTFLGGMGTINGGDPRLQLFK